MNRPRTYTSSGAESFSDAVWNLYIAMEKKFGSERAWEFVLTFYQQGGKKDG